MKRTYRLVWNDARDAWMAIAETRNNLGNRRRQSGAMPVRPGSTRKTAFGGRPFWAPM